MLWANLVRKAPTMCMGSGKRSGHFRPNVIVFTCVGLVMRGYT